MKKGKKGLTEKLIYNNKFLLFFSIVLAITIWATVKINYSTDIARVISDVKITLSENAEEDSDYKYFVDEDQLYVDVEISGKAYNINSNVINKDDIIVTTSEVYVDSAGYKVLSLNARFANGKGNGNAQIVSVIPSTIAVYYDREITGKFNVKAQLLNDEEGLIDENYIIGDLVAYPKTVEITGPETIVSQLNNVYFQAELDDDLLPLTATKTVSAAVKYEFNGTADSYYLSCPELETNPPTVTITVESQREIPTVIKYINEPSAYSAQGDNITVNPEKVKIQSNANDVNSRTQYIVGTVDFRELSNKVEVLTFKADSTSGFNMLVDDIEEFTVTVDFSDMSRRTIDGSQSRVHFINEKSGYSYNVNFESGGLNAITVIGPAESIEKITQEDIWIEINVSDLDHSQREPQSIEVSNISILSDQAEDCWIYGVYTATVTVAPEKK